MTKQLVEFKLHNGSVPYFVSERVPWINGPKYIGVSHDNETCYLPDTIVILTNDDVISKVTLETIMAPSDDVEPSTTELTIQEKTDLITEWLTCHI